MNISGPIKKARDLVARGWTSNAQRVEKDADGNVVKVCAQEAIDQCTSPGPVRRAVTWVVAHTSVMGGINPGEGNDDLGQEKVVAAFDEALAGAVLLEEAASV
jgi:hypothetical protein